MKSFSGQFGVRAHVCVCVCVCVCVTDVKCKAGELAVNHTHTHTHTHTVRGSRLWELWQSVWDGVLSLLGHTGFFATGFLQAFTSSGAVNQSESQIGCGWGWGQGWGALTSIKAREWMKVAFKYSNPALKWNVSNVFQRLLLSERKTLCSKHRIILFYTQDSLLSVGGMNLWVKKKKKKKKKNTKGSFMLYVLHIRIQLGSYVHISLSLFLHILRKLVDKRSSASGSRGSSQIVQARHNRGRGSFESGTAFWGEVMSWWERFYDVTSPGHRDRQTMLLLCPSLDGHLEPPCCSLHCVCVCVCVWGHMCYLFQQVLHLPLPALPRCHHLQFLLLRDLCERSLFVCFVVLAQLLLQQTHLLAADKHVEFAQNDICVSNLRICEEQKWKRGSVTAVHLSTSGPGRQPSCPSSAFPLSWWTSLWLHAAVSASLSPPTNTHTGAHVTARTQTEARVRLVLWSHSVVDHRILNNTNVRLLKVRKKR